MKYPPDKPGEEHTENARVWNVYLDEVESHDRDLLQGFRDIIDGVLVFASLFSAVVTTLVAQTSQVLQPDNTQIIASILFETNQLLRAAGNVTAINAVSKSALSPGSVVRTSRDVWVNGLFFTSLGLSLSTALLTVLVKQWLHAYSLFITGDAQRRARITHLRSQGLKSWRVREIVEALPLILHGSVLLFFVGLVLYVSQLSTPICAVLAIIAALAFIFYFGTSILPFVFIACPYRILFFFNACQSIRCCLLYLRKYTVSGILLARAFIPARLHDICQRKRSRWTSNPSRQSLESAETRAIDSKPHISLDILQQLLHTSDQRSTRQIVLDAVFAILKEYELPPERRRWQLIDSSRPFGHTLMEDIFRISLLEYTSTIYVDSLQAETIASTWEKRIASLSERIEIDGHKKTQHLFDAFRAADAQDNGHSRDCILDWIGKPALEDASHTMELLLLMSNTTGNGIRQILKRTGTGILSKLLWIDLPLLPYHARFGTLDQVKAVVEADGSDEVVNDVSSPHGFTPLDKALFSRRHEIVSYLMDHGGRAREAFYEEAFFYGIKDSNWDMVKVLWRRRREVRIVDTRPDSWCTKSVTEVANVVWRRGELDESKCKEVVEILQQCDKADVEEGHQSSSSHLEPVEELTELDSKAIDDPTSQTRPLPCLPSVAPY